MKPSRTMALALALASTGSCYRHLAPLEPRADMAPSDLTSMAQGIPLLVGVSGFEGDSFAEADIVASVRLRNLTNQALLAIDVTKNKEHGLSLSVVPRQPLEAAWHELSVEGVTGGATRFHPGSSPVLVSVVVYEKPTGTWRASLRFSEPLPLTRALVAQSIVVEQPRTGGRCEPAASYDFDQPIIDLYLECSIRDTSPIRFELRPGISSATQVPLRQYGGETSFVEELPFKDGAARKEYTLGQ